MQDMNEQQQVNPFMALLNEAGGESPYGTMQNDDPRTVTQPYNTKKPEGGISNAEANTAVPGADLPTDPREAQLQPGENPSQSKNLVSAINSLEAVVSASTDKQEIALLRGVLAALARLMGKNQEGLRLI